MLYNDPLSFVPSKHPWTEPQSTRPQFGPKRTHFAMFVCLTRSLTRLCPHSSLEDLLSREVLSRRTWVPKHSRSSTHPPLNHSPYPSFRRLLALAAPPPPHNLQASSRVERHHASSRIPQWVVGGVARHGVQCLRSRLLLLLLLHKRPVQSSGGLWCRGRWCGGRRRRPAAVH